MDLLQHRHDVGGVGWAWQFSHNCHHSHGIVVTPASTYYTAVLPLCIWSAKPAWSVLLLASSVY